MSFTTTTRVKTILGIPAGITQQDVKIGYMVAYANQQMLDEMDLESLDQSYDETLDVDTAATNSLKLQHTPVISVAALTNSDSLVDSDDYYVKDGWIRLIGIGAYFTGGRQTVEITYRAGYAAVRADMELCADIMAVEDFNRGPKAGLQSERIGEYTYAMAKANAGPYSTTVDKILSKYRKAFA